MSQNNLYILLIGAVLLSGLIGSLLARIVSKKISKAQERGIHKTPDEKFTPQQKKRIGLSLASWLTLEIFILLAINNEAIKHTKQNLDTKYLIWIICLILWSTISTFTLSIRYKYAHWITVVPIVIFLFFEALQSFAIGGWFVLLLICLIIGLGIFQLKDKFLQPK